MRTTLTLDHDIEGALRELMRSSKSTFKEAVNSALRAGLAAPKRVRPEPFVQMTFDMGRPLIDLTKAASLATDLEDAEAIAKLARGA